MFSKITKKLDDYFYPGAAFNWDDEEFVKKIKSHLRPDFNVLDYGAGRGKTDILNFRDLVSSVTGVDIDDEVLENPHLDDKHVINPQEPLPFDDDTFDVIYSCNVLEHVAEPIFTFAEIQRVLKPGGIFLAKTTNKNHYIACVARLTPLWFHKKYNRMRGREEEDTFPTAYLCNSRKQLVKLAQSANLDLKEIKFIEWRPEYLRISPFTYGLGIAYEKMVNSTASFAAFRAVIIVSLRKPD